MTNKEKCKKHGVVHRNGGYPSCHSKNVSAGWEEEFRANFLNENGISDIEFIRRLLATHTEQARKEAYKNYCDMEKISVERAREEGAAEMKARIQSLVEEHDPSTHRKTSAAYWGNTLRKAIADL